MYVVLLRLDSLPILEFFLRMEDGWENRSIGIEGHREKDPRAQGNS